VRLLLRFAQGLKKKSLFIFHPIEEGEMSETATPKTQEEWLEHFKELAKEHGEMLAQPFIDFFADKILLTKKEVEEAREDFERNSKSPALPCLFSYEEERCRVRLKVLGLCRLCKKLTQVVDGER